MIIGLQNFYDDYCYYDFCDHLLLTWKLVPFDKVHFSKLNL